jgi:hypothetical protein
LILISCSPNLTTFNKNTNPSSQTASKIFITKSSIDNNSTNTPITNYDFGSVESLFSQSQAFTIQNQGKVSVPVLSVGAGVQSPFAFFNSTCESVLNPDSQCSFSITFSPTNSESYLLSLAIVYEDENSQTQVLNFPIQGSGITPSPTPTSSVTPTAVTGSSYIGCFSDSSTRALPITLATSGATVESCIALAAAQNLAYAGVQYGGQCFGGNSTGYDQESDSSCNMSCSANSNEICGGTWLNSIYSTVPVSVATSGTPGANWVSCANENSQCSFSGTALVAFGAGTTFTYKTFTGGTACTDSVFGDPDYGVLKNCYLQK